MLTVAKDQIPIPRDKVSERKDLIALHRMASTTNEELDPQDPFYSLLLDSPRLPKLRLVPQNTKYWYYGLEGPGEQISDVNIARVIRSTLPNRDGVLMIEDIDDNTISLLKHTFSGLDLLFLHQHVVRSEDLQAPPSKIIGGRSVVNLSSHATTPETTDGIHYDIFCAPRVFTSKNGLVKSWGDAKLAFSIDRHGLSDNLHSYRIERFTSDGSKWKRASTRISCCVLKPGLCLILVDAPLRDQNLDLDAEFGDSYSLMLPGNRYDQPGLLNWGVFNPGDTLSRVLDNFTAQSVASFITSEDATELARTLTFYSLLVVSEWQCVLDQFERDMTRFQSRATTSLTRSTLDAMGEFRRTLADSREFIADTEAKMLFWRRSFRQRSAVESYSEYAWQAQIPPFPSTNTANLRIPREIAIEETNVETINLSALIDRLAGLETRLEAITRTVNEEVQLFNTSISIRDSEVLLADSRIMKQQAARTTLLTTLAIIYLPLQLITGIFGINIKEITGDGRPRWWACFAALGVGGALTFLVCLSVKWWRQWRDSLRKKEKDV